VKCRGKNATAAYAFSLNVRQYSPIDQWRTGGMMKKASFADVKARVSAFLNESQEEPVVVMFLDYRHRVFDRVEARGIDLDK
jgi:hypothetical protein